MCADDAANAKIAILSVAVLLLLLAAPAGAQDKPRLGFRFQAGAEASASESKYALQPYPGWEAKFNLPRYTFYGVPRTDFYAPTEEVRSFIDGDVFVGLCPTLRLGAVELGIPVNLYLSNFISFPVTKFEVDLNEFEEDAWLAVSKIGIRKTTPAAGLSLRFGRERGVELQLLGFGYALTEYHCLETAYEAESRHRTGVGGMFYEVDYYTDYRSDAFEEFLILNGAAFHLSVGLWGDGGRFSGFLEKAGRYLRGGMTLALDL